MAHIEDALLFSLAQKGEHYVFGAEVPGTTSDKWDCSELVEVACRAAGVKPVVPDGAYWQWKHCSKISVTNGVATRGALLFVGDGVGVGRDAITHVAWSLGNGTTIEARGTAWGVGVWPTASRFDFAGLLPGVDYSPRKPLPPPPEVDVIGKDIFDQNKGTVDLVTASILGRILPDGERDFWIVVLAEHGYEALVNGVAGTPEGQRKLAARA